MKQTKCLSAVKLHEQFHVVFDYPDGSGGVDTWTGYVQFFYVRESAAKKPTAFSGAFVNMSGESTSNPFWLRHVRDFRLIRAEVESVCNISQLLIEEHEAWEEDLRRHPDWFAGLLNH